MDWMKQAVIYQIFIDRFYGCNTMTNLPEFLGGNLNGITKKLDYLSNMGINVIWLSPFYQTTQYHGYHITDYKKVDSHFGTLKDLKRLVFEANSRGIRVIADFVPNHCSDQHPFFQDAQNNRSGKYADWFTFEKWPDDYSTFMDYKDLPKLNFENREVRDYIIGMADYWLSLGLDGFRIDYAIGIPHSFWKEFRKVIKTKYPKKVLIGEVWCENLDKKQFKTVNIKNKRRRKIFGISQQKLQLEYYNELDGVLDFALNKMLTESVKEGEDLLANDKLRSRIQEHFRKVPSDYLMVTFLDNHDMDRFLRHCKGDITILLDAFELLLSLDYPVVIYNGTENCTYNERPVDPSVGLSDLTVRAPFDWDNINQEFSDGLRNLIVKYRKADYALKQNKNA